LCQPRFGTNGCCEYDWSPRKPSQVSTERRVVLLFRLGKIERLAITADRARKIANGNHHARHARVLRAGRFARWKRTLVARSEILYEEREKRAVAVASDLRRLPVQTIAVRSCASVANRRL